MFSWTRWTEKLTPGRAVGTSQASLSLDIVQEGLVPPLFKTHQLVCGLQVYFRFLYQHALQGKAPRRLTQSGLQAQTSREQISLLHTFHLPTSEPEARPPSAGRKHTGWSCRERS